MNAKRSRTLLRAAFAAVLVTAACNEPDAPPEAELRRYRDAVALQERGSFAEAVIAFEGLERDATDAVVRARSALGRTQIETAIARRVAATARLDALVAEAAALDPALAEGLVARAAREADGTPFQGEVEEHARWVRGKITRAIAARRATDADGVRGLAAGGQFLAAMERVRELEAGRTGDDRGDLRALVDEVQQASDAAADLLLAEFSRRGTDSAAIAWLRGEAVRFGGTRGAARMVEAARQAESEGPEAAKPTGTAGAKENGGSRGR